MVLPEMHFRNSVNRQHSLGRNILFSYRPWTDVELAELAGLTRLPVRQTKVFYVLLSTSAYVAGKRRTLFVAVLCWNW